jgi:hypothetical protein
MEYDEMVDVMNKGVQELADVTEVLNPKIAQMLNLGEYYSLGFSHMLLERLEDDHGRDVYKFSVIVTDFGEEDIG